MYPQNITHLPPTDFLKQEERIGYTISEEMKKVWSIQIDMVLKLIEVCQRHNLRIYADGGTLLGAIRHKGFIPWDDDIDMVMMRQDYDKLMELADEFEHPYFLQNIYRDNHYTFRHAQLRNSETACYPRSLGKCPYHYNNGIFVDIFVADNMPTSPRRFARYYKKEGLVRQRFRLTSKLINKLPQSLYLWLRNHTTALSDKALYHKYEELLRSVPLNPQGYVSEISFQHGSCINAYQDFGEPQYVDFEYIKMPIPQNPLRLLELQYGADFMTPQQLPAIHNAMAFDIDHSYTTHF